MFPCFSVVQSESDPLLLEEGGEPLQMELRTIIGKDTMTRLYTGLPTYAVFFWIYK